MQDAGCGAGRLHVRRVLHGSHNSGHHLRGLHQSPAGRLLAGQLVHDHCCLIHHDLKPRERVRGQDMKIL